MGKFLASLPGYDEEKGIPMVQLHALILLWCEDSVPEKAKALVQMVGVSPTDGDVCFDDKDIRAILPAMFIMASVGTIQHASTIDDELLAYDVEADLPLLAPSLEDSEQLAQAATYLTFGYSPDNANPAFNGVVQNVFGSDASLSAGVFIQKVHTNGSWMFEPAKIRRKMNALLGEGVMGTQVIMDE